MLAVLVPIFQPSLHENEDDFLEKNNILPTMSTRMSQSLKRVFAFASLALFGLGAMGQAAIFNVHDHGAQGDGRTLDSPAIQETIDACAKAGGGMVRLAPGTYLSKPLFLRGNNTTLQLDAGAVLQGTQEFAD